MASRHTHVMVDIETLGTRPGSVIHEIGAVVFEPEQPDEECLREIFEVYISPMDCEQRGLTSDKDTVNWWLDRGGIYPASFRLGLDDGLRLFSLWFRQVMLKRPGTEPLVWAKGPSFDLILLEHAYRVVDKEPPWTFRAHRDVRTILDLGEVPESCRVGQAHAARADACTQARQVTHVLQSLHSRLRRDLS